MTGGFGGIRQYSAEPGRFGESFLRGGGVLGLEHGIKAAQGAGSSGRGSVGRSIGRWCCEWRPGSQSERSSERATLPYHIQKGFPCSPAFRIQRLSRGGVSTYRCTAGLLLFRTRLSDGQIRR